MDDFSWGTTRQLSATPSPVVKPALSGNTTAVNKTDQRNPSADNKVRGPVDVDSLSADETKFDPEKYKNAEEAKQARAMRRAAC